MTIAAAASLKAIVKRIGAAFRGEGIDKVCNIARQMWSNREDLRGMETCHVSIFSAQSKRNLASDIQQGALP
jgi:hypothetical protein